MRPPSASLSDVFSELSLFLAVLSILARIMEYLSEHPLFKLLTQEK